MGRNTWKVVPLAQSRVEVRKRIVPWCLRTRVFDTHRPRPEPFSSLVVKKGSNICSLHGLGYSRAAIVDGHQRAVTSGPAGWSNADASRRVPGGAASAALRTRLPKTWLSWPGKPWMERVGAARRPGEPAGVGQFSIQSDDFFDDATDVERHGVLGVAMKRKRLFGDA